MPPGAPLGNRNAAGAKEWAQAIKRACADRSNGDYRATLQRIAARIVEAAEEGDRECWQEIGNRMDGKPHQSVDIGGDPDNPLVVDNKVVIEFVGGAK